MTETVIPPLDWRDWKHGRSEAWCDGDSHAFTPPVQDGEWHDLTCHCGMLTVQGRRDVEGARISHDLW